MAALSALLISNQHTKKTRDPYDDFHLRIAPIQSPVRIDRPMKIKITNIDGEPDVVQLELHELVMVTDTGHREPFWEIAAAEFHKKKGKYVDLPAIGGHQSVTITWRPNSKGFKPNLHHQYRIMVLGGAALMGGGPVSYSNEFRFTKK